MQPSQRDVLDYLKSLGIDLDQHPIVRSVDWTRGVLRLELAARMPNGESLDAYVTCDGHKLTISDDKNTTIYAGQMWGKWDENSQREVIVEFDAHLDAYILRSNEISVSSTVRDERDFTDLLLRFVCVRMAVYGAMRP